MLFAASLITSVEWVFYISRHKVALMCQQYLNGFGDLFEEEIRDLKKSSSRQTVWRFIDYIKYVCQTLDVKP